MLATRDGIHLPSLLSLNILVVMDALLRGEKWWPDLKSKLASEHRKAMAVIW
ncbi:hypothetical protein Mapa_002831 [Marchantia paleacea]|nr:hypothetical protein Mapa_002831 [Marchantia paleacea]